MCLVFLEGSYAIRFDVEIIRGQIPEMDLEASRSPTVGRATEIKGSEYPGFAKSMNPRLELNGMELLADRDRSENR